MTRITSTPPTHIPLFTKPETRDVSKVFLHCSASSKPYHARIDTIDTWHRKRGFDEIGYHYLIDFEGMIWHGRNIEKTPAAQKGHNTGSIAICIAGLRVQDFRLIQLDAMRHLCHEIDWAYRGSLTFHGHCEVSAKTCPVFDYKHYLNLDDDGNLNGKMIRPSKALEVFDTGIDVVDLQKKLNIWLGQTSGRMVMVDGLFGNDTAEAVMEFQEKNDLIVTGIADSMTKLQLPRLSYKYQTNT